MVRYESQTCAAGAVAEEPNHGYELKKRYDDTLGARWPVQQAQIYNNLRLLEKAGQITLETRVEEEPARPKVIPRDPYRGDRISRSAQQPCSQQPPVER